MIANEDDARAFVAERCNDEALGRLDGLARDLVDESARQNLVAAASLPHLWRRHFADSAQLLDFAGAGEGAWLDLGTGAGFPGLIIAAMRPKWEIVLVESRRMRIDWLRRMMDRLGLDRCRVEGLPLERVATVPAQVISARAFAPLPKLLALANRFSTSDTYWLLPKGRSAAQEVAELPRAMRNMFHVEQSQTDPEAGIIVGRGRGPESKRG